MTEMPTLLFIGVVLVFGAGTAACQRNPASPSGWRAEAPVPGALPFGPKGIPETLFARPFSGGYLVLNTTSSLRRVLDDARAARVRLIVKPVGGHWRYQNADGTFSLAKWKAELDTVRGFDFEAYVRDGTVLGIELVNEPHVAEKWGGQLISKDDLEEAARYAKSIWPSLPVGAGRSDYLLQRAPWRHLDFSHSQYHMRKGDVESWRRATVGECQAAGVALLLSLNFFAGEPGNAPMTADEVRRYGSVLAGDSYACALTGYVYDPTYFARPGMAAAFAAVAAVAAGRQAPPCYVGSVKP